MENQYFYQLIREADLTRSQLVIRFVNGDYTGEGALLTEGRLVPTKSNSTEELLIADSGIPAVETGKTRTTGTTGNIRTTGTSRSDLVAFMKDHEKELSELNGAGLIEMGGQTIFYERLSGPKKLFICGAGHVSIPIIRIGKMIGFHITVLDDRPAFTAKAKAAGADRVICDSFASGLDGIAGNRDTSFIIVTRGHRSDMDCLERILRKPRAYIGMMGSRRRTGIIRDRMIEKGFNKEELDEVHMPIGLPIAAETPEEIAVSVMAEIIQVINSDCGSFGYPEEILDGLTSSSAVLATIIKKTGAAPRAVGTKMLVLKDGRTIGTIGGGCAEAGVVTAAINMLRGIAEPNRIITVDMTADQAEEEGMVCGGRIQVFLEEIFG